MCVNLVYIAREEMRRDTTAKDPKRNPGRESDGSLSIKLRSRPHNSKDGVVIQSQFCRFCNPMQSDLTNIQLEMGQLSARALLLDQTPSMVCILPDHI
jgi:hypothetical protein